MMPNL